jgi:hypothetical protein
VVGFRSKINIKTNRLNNLLLFICFTMYKYKMKCRLKKETMSMVSFQNKIKYCLCLQNEILKKVHRINDDLYYSEVAYYL